MQVGLWVEPEMINLDSDLARDHPDWLLAAPGRLPLEWRSQHVLDLARADVAAYLLVRLDELVTTYELDFLKWDHNRDLAEAVHAPTGAAGVRQQTLALYALLDALRERHPRLEIESCASGGGRIDLGILERTDRVWASDTNDALERQQIQRWVGLLVPPEMIGSHLGGPVSHTTGRTLGLGIRAITSLFGHMGFELDLTTCAPAELAELATWVALYKELRPLLHSGAVVRADLDDPGAILHGVVNGDRSAGVFAHVRLATAAAAAAGRIVLPGLDDARTYDVRLRGAGHTGPHHLDGRPGWWMAPGGRPGAGLVGVPGTVLGAVGIQLPALHPGEATLVQVTENDT
jgi:alpha-galactosidase